MNSSVRKLLLAAAVLVLSSLLPVTSASALPAAATQSRVIVKLALPPEADATSIYQATDSLLAVLPVGDYTVVNRPSTLPYLTLSAGASAMSVLRSSSLVASIERDGTVSAVSRSCKKRARACKRRARGLH